MARRTSFALGRIVARMAELSAPGHRELVRGMVSELDAIADPDERRRFALGAIAAIVRMALTGYSAAIVQAAGRLVGIPDPEDGSTPGGPSMSQPTTRQLLRRHVTPFAVSFTSVTVLLLANSAMRTVPQLRARGAPSGTIVEALVLAVPHTVALTIPMAVLLAVSWVFTGLGREGVLAAAQRRLHGVRRLVAPVMGAAAVIALLTAVSNTQLVPRANMRLGAVLADGPRAPSDRTMTVGELREAARHARTDAGSAGEARAAAYEVEIQKKFALAAACMVLALAGAAVAFRFQRGGAGFGLSSSGAVFALYYFAIVAGESLADRLLISPFFAMWMANLCLLAVVALLQWRPGDPGGTRGAESLAIGG